MGLSRRTASRTTSNLRTEYWAKSFPLLVALVSASTFLVSCATPDVLGDKEEYARQSGKGGVIGIHQGLETIDDPLVTKLRTALLQDEFLQRLVTQLAQAAVVGARQGVSDLHPDQSAAAITEAIAGTLDRHLEQTGLRLLGAAESTAYRTSVRTVRESVLVAADSFAIASPRYSAAMRNVVGSSVDGALDALSERLEKRTGELLKDELPRFVSIISRTAAREAVGGFKQGIREEFPGTPPAAPVLDRLGAHCVDRRVDYAIHPAHRQRNRNRPSRA